MSERSPTPLAVAVTGLLLAIVSYAIKDENIGRLVYGSGLLSAGLAVLHWFAAPPPGRRSPPRL